MTNVGIPEKKSQSQIFILLRLRFFLFFLLLTGLHFSKNMYTVKPVLSGHSKIDKTNILMTNGSFMKVESIAKCSTGSILHYF